MSAARNGFAEFKQTGHLLAITPEFGLRAFQDPSERGPAAYKIRPALKRLKWAA
jgi:hypothetical protein